jgi:large subunit ribosomal protein L13
MNKNKDNLTKWHHIDASGQILGRMATEIAVLLQGKDQADYAPNKIANTRVVITNTNSVALSGRKEDQKLYRHYSGYPGGLKERSVREQRHRDSTKIVERAIEGMLPKNNLRKQLMRHVYFYPDANHPHQAHLKPNNPNNSVES